MEQKETRPEDSFATNLSLALPPGKRVAFQIQGIQQASDAGFIEQQLRRPPGVQHVYVDTDTGRGEPLCSQEPSLEEAQRALHRYGYALLPRQHVSPASLPSPNSSFSTTSVLFRVEGIQCASCVRVSNAN